jgi:Arc/MetJ family transcription regulator
VRTTVNIDEHLLAEAKVWAARGHRSLGEVIDEALRLRFAAAERQTSPTTLPTFGVRGQRALVDIDDRDAVAEALGENLAPNEQRPDDSGADVGSSC